MGHPLKRSGSVKIVYIFNERTSCPYIKRQILLYSTIWFITIMQKHQIMGKITINFWKNAEMSDIWQFFRIKFLVDIIMYYLTQRDWNENKFFLQKSFFRYG